MLFRFLLTIGSLFGFVTGGLDLLERFGVPVDRWLRALPDIASDFFAWFGFQIDRVTAAIFGTPAPETTASVSQPQTMPNGEEIIVTSRSLAMVSSSEALWISGGFTALMFIILLIASRRG